MRREPWSPDTVGWFPSITTEMIHDRIVVTDIPTGDDIDDLTGRFSNSEAVPGCECDTHQCL